ncbi:hypothetical protein [Paenibacillus jamilae]|uniref:hypothetical protein n=1 Tax=Paenibacillus jamilae TaxID=114136 RepID=UPI0007375595|nr:hypothetical protein [Paenibacillus jamilae]
MPILGLSTESNEVTFSGTVAELIEFAKGMQSKKEATTTPIPPHVGTQSGRFNRRAMMTARERLVEDAATDVRRQSAIVERFRESVEFHVNAEKGTVVALVKGRSGRVVHRGIAKTAPGDVFNASIGRAIALRRAMGKYIPRQLMNAPQPEGVKAGDIVEYINSWDGFGTTAYAKRIRVVQSGTAVQGLTAQEGSIIATRGKLVDDSREVIE